MEEYEFIEALFYEKVTLVKKRDTGELFALKSIKKSEIDAKNQWEHTKTERMVLENVNLFIQQIKNRTDKTSIFGQLRVLF